MYRRSYKEALRQKEAIRRSSVPSQQHLIVDSDSVRSRFQTLQANGFRSSNNLKKLPAVTNQQSATINVAATPPAKPTAPPAIIMTSSESNEGLTKIDEVETKSPLCYTMKELRLPGDDTDSKAWVLPLLLTAMPNLITLGEPYIYDALKLMHDLQDVRPPRRPLNLEEAILKLDENYSFLTSKVVSIVNVSFTLCLMYV